MSAISETEVGGEIVCIGSFSGCPHGETPSWETRRRFRVGERVRYAGYYQDENLKDNSAGWMVLFDAADGKRYRATQTFFVSVECWEGLKKYFARQLLQEPRRPRRRSSQKPGV
jgi:hypothetical protein